MFARTSRLMLRPAWAEDARVLGNLLADAMICRALWHPVDQGDWVPQPSDPLLPSLLIFERTSGAPRLIGACGLSRRASGALVLKVWIDPAQRGRGFASEACAALLEIAATLGFRQIEAGHEADDPAAAALLGKLGFRSTGLAALPSGKSSKRQVPTNLLRARLCDKREALAA
ncbi:GNAT family N-acetyltransferase [Sphingomonas piscis]|uniref:GNAT family N-acetyltransferase n=1 Tax=Sphingomonas piscis TaxID=2714943 RepID=A0A6G7YNY1_9SPHN|nr:GNAT family N-acetyltransferase [Sphingomonas piscis]QIK78444.1 GNAT family N-acetyltransferase [Sphingomonas piscis]